MKSPMSRPTSRASSRGSDRPASRDSLNASPAPTSPPNSRAQSPSTPSDAKAGKKKRKKKKKKCVPNALFFLLVLSELSLLALRSQPGDQLTSGSRAVPRREDVREYPQHDNRLELAHGACVLVVPGRACLPSSWKRCKSRRRCGCRRCSEASAPAGRCCTRRFSAKACATRTSTRGRKAGTAICARGRRCARSLRWILDTQCACSFTSSLPLVRLPIWDRQPKVLHNHQ